MEREAVTSGREMLPSQREIRTRSGGVRDSFLTDTTLSRPITSAKKASCLQQDLDAVYTWAATSNMQFNEDKYEILRHGHNQERKETARLYSEECRKSQPYPHQMPGCTPQ
ncbi:hypothetical protein Pcinc_007226 [Petrolisthes cinctipes]|uniref:Uncharacterized protein n=1 Tax=Petrolisthes cinctipes TaxID=88211 RepID=A0AAE1GBG7_PETCI|nr:hypothetical protein Pcinc_007226 [Petrolisthes cinctipes]